MPDSSIDDPPITIELTEEEKATQELVTRWMSSYSGRSNVDKQPDVSHLKDGVVLAEVSGSLAAVPLFNIGDRIVVERHASLNPKHDWLDTEVYIVRSIDDDTGIVRCWDVRRLQQSVLCFKSEHQRFKLCPKRGNPFRENEQPEPPPEEHSAPAGVGAKSKPKKQRKPYVRRSPEEVRASKVERLEKLRLKAEKQLKRKAEIALSGFKRNTDRKGK